MWSPVALKIYNDFPYKGVCEYSFKNGKRKRTHYIDDWRRYDDVGWFHQKMYCFFLKHIFFSILLQPLTPKIEFNWYIIGYRWHWINSWFELWYDYYMGSSMQICAHSYTNKFSKMYILSMGIYILSFNFNGCF